MRPGKAVAIAAPPLLEDVCLVVDAELEEAALLAVAVDGALEVVADDVVSAKVQFAKNSMMIMVALIGASRLE